LMRRMRRGIARVVMSKFVVMRRLLGLAPHP
jgi:hypothetical protein